MLLNLTAIAGIAMAGLLLGVRLGDQASQPGEQVLTLERPSTVAPREAGLRSLAGFSGFEDGALGGLVARAGAAQAVDGNLLVVESASARTEIRYTSPTRFFVIAGAQGGPQAGDVVVARLAPDGSAEALLIVPGDIREGDAR
ncbi:MAG: hypothetical protein DWG82_03790 [Chloroflexi bacterium]|nr:hypothetical protein [Chloroflexota bacterium]